MGSFLSCQCLGDQIFGKDLDDVFAYVTPKQVRVKHRFLGVLRISLMLLIFVYIGVFQIAYNGEHFQKESVEGVARLQWQQPTMNWCNPMDVECRSNLTDSKDLPYCEQYVGAEKWKAARQRTCMYKDAWEMPIQLPNGVLMPTHLETFRQKRMCEPNAVACLSKYQFQEGEGVLQSHKGEARPINDAFVANVEDFTVLIDHSFSTSNGLIAYDDFRMQGYWLDCSEGEEQCVRRPIKCVHSKCDRMGFGFLQDGCIGEHCGTQHAPSRQLRRGHNRAGELSLAQEGSGATDRQGALAEAQKMNVIALSDGDVLSIKTMLAMAQSSAVSTPPPPGGYSLDSPISDGEDETLRLRGAAIVVRIDYDNYEHWRLFRPKDPPTYTISVAWRPATEFKHLYVSKQDEHSREVTKAYGIMIVVQQFGRICVFNPLHGLIILTSALGLLAMSNLLTDMLAMNVLPISEKFTDLKFQVSEDMVTVNPDKES